jgi:chromosome segregation ATPase
VVEGRGGPICSAPGAGASGSLRSVSDDDGGLRGRIQSQGEDAIGKLAQDLLENPLINGAIARAFEAREKAVQAQEVALGALNLPSAADLERLTRRVRSVSQRLEGIEDGVDRLDERIAGLDPTKAFDARLGSIEEQIEGLARQLAALREAIPEAVEQVPREQERLEVSER